jgi:hypothetical protein
MPVKMNLPHASYSEPRFHSSSPDFIKLKGAAELTIDTPGAALALAMDYYRVEAFASEEDRDLACGPTEREDVRYFPVSRGALIKRSTDLLDIACGHSLDHPAFERIVSPLFCRTIQEVVKDASTTLGQPKEMGGVIAKCPITIARVRYNLSLIKSGDWLNFDVEAISLFEQMDTDLVDRTIRHLQEALVDQLSPMLRQPAHVC